MDELVIGDVIIPLPSGSTPADDRPPAPWTAEVRATAPLSFTVPGDTDTMRAFYVTWAQQAGWDIELYEDDAIPVLRVARAPYRLGIMIAPWVGGESIVTIAPVPEAAAVAMTYRRLTVPPLELPPLALPPVTRAYPPARACEDDEPRDPTALVCDRGLLFVARGDRIDMLDPTTQKLRTVVGGAPDGFEVEGHPDEVTINGATGLVVDDTGVWFLDRGRDALRHIDFATETVTTVARELPRPRHLVRLGATFYALGEDGELVVIESGAVRTLAGAFARRHHGWKEAGLVAARDRLFVAAEPEAIHAVDPATGAVELLVELPVRPRSLTTDGDALYVGAYDGIWRVGIADRRCESLTSDVRDAQCIAWDGGAGVYFLDEHRVRWLDLAQRRVRFL